MGNTRDDSVAPERSVQKEVMKSIDPHHANGTMAGSDSIE
jgi:hypothetical protein